MGTERNRIDQSCRDARVLRSTSPAPLRPPGFSERIALGKVDPHGSDKDLAPLLSSTEVARWLGISQRTVCLWAELNEIPGFKLGHQWRFSETDVRVWLKARLAPSESSDPPER
jgi:excisionase family DNA binding protein